MLEKLKASLAQAERDLSLAKQEKQRALEVPPSPKVSRDFKTLQMQNNQLNDQVKNHQIPSIFLITFVYFG